jgi:hypothetical protein
MTVPFVFDGGILAVKQCLAPTLKRGNVVIMDNAKITGVRQKIETAVAAPLSLSLFARLEPGRNGLQQTEGAFCGRQPNTQFWACCAR